MVELESRARGAARRRQVASHLMIAAGLARERVRARRAVAL